MQCKTKNIAIFQKTCSCYFSTHGLRIACYGARTMFNSHCWPGVLDVMLLDLFAQCVAVQAVRRVRGPAWLGWYRTWSPTLASKSI